MTAEITVHKLKTECHDIQHEIDLMELKLINFREAKELKLERIDRIEMRNSE